MIVVEDAPVNNNGNDLSDRAKRLARMIDRLAPGTYNINFMKPDLDAASWRVEIERLEFIQKTDLDKRRA